VQTYHEFEHIVRRSQFLNTGITEPPGILGQTRWRSASSVPEALSMTISGSPIWFGDASAPLPKF